MIQELRIGNYLNEKSNGIARVVSITEQGKNEFKIGVIVKPFNNYTLSNPILSPIEISEELLLKCGFEYFKEAGYCDKNNIIYQTNDGWELLINCIDRCSENIKYLHELQNINYAIFKEELKVNL